MLHVRRSKIAHIILNVYAYCWVKWKNNTSTVRKLRQQTVTLFESFW